MTQLGNLICNGILITSYKNARFITQGGSADKAVNVALRLSCYADDHAFLENVGGRKFGLVKNYNELKLGKKGSRPKDVWIPCKECRLHIILMPCLVWDSLNTVALTELAGYAYEATSKFHLATRQNSTSDQCKSSCPG